MEELISILMVNYNHVDVIIETIESVLAQSYTNLKDGMVKQDVENKKVNDELTGRIKELEHRIEEYEYSTSWQLTKPFRTVMKAIRRK